MKDIEVLKEEELEAIKVLGNIKRQIRDYWLKKHEEDYGVFVGAIVVLKNGKKAVVDSVIVKSWHGCKPWLTGRIENKDGSFGKAKRNLYSNWEVLNK